MSAAALSDLFYARSEVARWRAEFENASARLELAEIAERKAYLLSQYEPLKSLGMDADRDKLALLFRYLGHGDLARLKRDGGVL